MMFLKKQILLLSFNNIFVVKRILFIHRTEFQMKFLWGSKGSMAPAVERHTKLEQILSLMAEKFCGTPNLALNGD